MKTTLHIATEEWPVKGVFTISRGSRRVATTVLCQLERDGAVGRGECAPYARYGETAESVAAQIEAARALVEGGADRAAIAAAMPAGAARNAVDCALWDLEAKTSGTPVSVRMGFAPPRPLETAVTISLDDPEEMGSAARALATRPVIKIKLGGDGDEARMRAVRAAAPAATLIADANESWSEADASALLLVAARLRFALIEQPLPAGKDGMLREIPHPVPICADESAHTSADLESLRGLYDCINIKLDKAGGLTEALEMRRIAHRLGFSVMVGCMLSTSLSMAPAVLLAQEAEYADLDGPLLLDRDRPDALSYSPSLVSPPSPALWG